MRTRDLKKYIYRSDKPAQLESLVVRRKEWARGRNGIRNHTQAIRDNQICILDARPFVRNGDYKKLFSGFAEPSSANPFQIIFANFRNLQKMRLINNGSQYDVIGTFKYKLPCEFGAELDVNSSHLFVEFRLFICGIYSNQQYLDKFRIFGKMIG